MITISNIRKTFGDKVALDIGQYSVGKGEVVGLVGNNGAGKTTLFRVLLDLIKPDCGTAFISGMATSETEEWKTITGSYIDSGYLIDYLTPDEYFSFIGKVNGIGKTELSERLSRYERFMNGEVVGQKKLIRNLSAGNRQKVGVVAALLIEPQLLILDEPFNYLDPSSQLSMEKMLEQYNRDTGATIVVSSHSLDHTFGISTRITLLEDGKVIKDLPRSEETRREIEEYFISQVRQ